MADPTQTLAAPPGGNADASDLESARFLARAYAQLQGEIAKVIVGQQRVVDELLMAVFAAGSQYLSARRESKCLNGKPVTAD